MNNLNPLRNFFGLSVSYVSAQLNTDPATINAWENGSQIPSDEQWQALVNFYTRCFSKPQAVNSISGLSLAYIQNQQLTLNDLLVFKNYFETTRPELGEFTFTLYDPAKPIIMERITDLATAIARFGGYIPLNPTGDPKLLTNLQTNTQFDWRLLMYKSERLMIDVTTDFITTENLTNYSIM